MKDTLKRVRWGKIALYFGLVASLASLGDKIWGEDGIYGD